MERLDEGVERRCLERMLEEIRQTPYPAFAAFAVLAGLAWEEGQRGWALTWFGLLVGLQLIRQRLAARIRREPRARAVDDLRPMLVWFAVSGLTTAAIVPAYFLDSSLDSAYFASMILMGLAAGGLVSANGSVAAMALWGGPFFLVLALAWASTGTTRGWLLAVLVLVLFHVFLTFVRDQRRMIAQLVSLAEEKAGLADSLRHERDRAEAASESRTRFFRAASHDLRQPLQALGIHVTHLNLLASRRNEPVLSELGRGLATSLDQARSLVTSLLDLSRLEIGAFRVMPEALALDRLVSTLVDSLRPSPGGSDLALVFEAEPRPEGWWVTSDADLLRRIVLNVVGNALKFTARGEVRVTLIAEGEWIRLRIIDTGPGIATEDHSRVFEEFYQAGLPARDRAQGLGLGLAIVRRSVDLLGLEMVMTSAPGEGCCFEFRLPATAPVAVPAAVPAAAADPGIPAGRLSPRQVLVVDDEVEIRTACSRLFTSLGWSVRSAAGGQEALAALADGWQPDVAVVDYRLGGESGVDAVALLDSEVGGMATIILSGDGVPEAINARFPVLLKPVSGEALVELACWLTGQGRSAWRAGPDRAGWGENGPSTGPAGVSG